MIGKYENITNMCLTRITVHSGKFNPVDIMVIDKTDSLEFYLFLYLHSILWVYSVHVIVLQNYARRKNVPVEKTRFEFKILKEGKKIALV